MFDFNKLIKAAPQYNIVYIAVFGSVASGRFTPQSDIDLLVKFGKRKSLLDMVRTERELSELMGSKIDLLTENSISPYIRENIQKELKVIYNEG